MEDKINLIKEKIPHLDIKEYHQNKQGQNNDVLIINNEWVFRFPKYRAGIEQLKKETVILDYASSKLSIPVPQPAYQFFFPEEPGMVFTGYRILPGSPLWKNDMTDLDRTRRQQAAVDLAVFLKELHSISPDSSLGSIQQSEPTCFDEMKDLHERLKTKIYPFMKQESIDEVDDRFTEYFGSCQSVSACIIHGDFGCSNILWDKDRVSGIIDFGGAGFSDPAYDVAGLLASYGEEFIQMMIPHYPEITSFLNRVHFYKSTFALQEALFGIENGDQEAFENGMAGYKK
ncbi:phosphotransferase family protein [Bacillus sp. Marseille-Q1617]|uniref:phosphotransferase family protein n=1 Tax=Bacillus sp. Marseille-Q1617 TaxID=2736887 RepID=UPI00158E64B9|nr:aminoglycoside phosphotransferase family protein [Bacillus sp. Marseille-Q1617]